jgi:hypothetical protein
MVENNSHLVASQNPHQMMSQPKYQLPLNPSPQMKVVLDYFKCLSRWDLDKLATLSSPNFTQSTLPASMSIQTRTKNEDITFLKGFRDSLKSAPLVVCHR